MAIIDNVVIYTLLFSWISRPLLAATTCPSDTSTYVVGGAKRCFHVSNMKGNFNDYKKKCTDKGGTTLTVDSKGVADFFKNSFSQSKLNDYWIGLEMTTGFTWTATNEAVKEDLWKKNKDGSECVFLKHDKWESTGCSNNGVHYYVCEKSTTAGKDGLLSDKSG
ncbi:uncharacterized protein LOC135500811 [Lineus longissimus]|uniref:uncharacterized protein LOC135500811 n=1 Tax=Lineus longissimus TaxID=88925 RepID=UPI00315CB540